MRPKKGSHNYLGGLCVSRTRGKKGFLAIKIEKKILGGSRHPWRGAPRFFSAKNAKMTQKHLISSQNASQGVPKITLTATVGHHGLARSLEMEDICVDFRLSEAVPRRVGRSNKRIVVMGRQKRNSAVQLAPNALNGVQIGRTGRMTLKKMHPVAF